LDKLEIKYLISYSFMQLIRLFKNILGPFGIYKNLQINDEVIFMKDTLNIYKVLMTKNPILKLTSFSVSYFHSHFNDGLLRLIIFVSKIIVNSLFIMDDFFTSTTIIKILKKCTAKSLEIINNAGVRANEAHAKIKYNLIKTILQTKLDKDISAFISKELVINFKKQFLAKKIKKSNKISIIVLKNVAFSSIFFFNGLIISNNKRNIFFPKLLVNNLVFFSVGALSERLIKDFTNSPNILMMNLKSHFHKSHYQYNRNKIIITDQKIHLSLQKKLIKENIYLITECDKNQVLALKSYVTKTHQPKNKPLESNLPIIIKYFYELEFHGKRFFLMENKHYSLCLNIMLIARTTFNLKILKSQLFTSLKIFSKLSDYTRITYGSGFIELFIYKYLIRSLYKRELKYKRIIYCYLDSLFTIPKILLSNSYKLKKSIYFFKFITLFYTKYGINSLLCNFSLINKLGILDLLDTTENIYCITYKIASELLNMESLIIC